MMLGVQRGWKRLEARTRKNGNTFIYTFIDKFLREGNKEAKLLLGAEAY